ncbi:MAG: redoxin domain-containing protein [Bacteroidetes bacterium]|nr:redoxin domain-containing protein [Bacteroidota bacterium]
MRFYFSILLTVILLNGFVSHERSAYVDHPTLSIGSPAPDFNLPAVDGKNYSLASFSKAKILVIIFTCNHCPTAQAYEDRIIKLTSDYTSKNIAVVVINPNDPKALRLDELDFSDLGDSFEDMKTRAKDKSFNFPYLYDGETQSVSRAYGPVATPHVFIFDKERKLRYVGRFDDMESPFKTPRNNDTRDAIEALLHDQEVKVQTTKVFGCSVKWAEKKDLVKKALDKWATEPVNINTIDDAGTKDIFKNSTNKLFLINIWSNNCKQCETNFPEFITMNRMYRDRDFEFISINAGKPGDQQNALGFLQKQQASNKNYFFSAGSRSSLIASIDPSWNGNIPYTLLVEPGGKIVYTKQGLIDAAEMKRTIVNNHLIGKYP